MKHLMKQLRKHLWVLFLVLIVLVCAILYISAYALSTSHQQSFAELNDSGEYSGLTADYDADLAALVPENIRGKGVLVAGSQTGYAPNEFVASDNKTVIGFEIELFRLICEKLGLKPEISYSSFDQIIPAIGKIYDIGVSGFTVSPERAEIVDFVPFYRGGESFAYSIDKEGQIADPALDQLALCGLTVGVQIGTAQDEELDDYNADCLDNSLPEITVLRYQEEAGAYIALLGGKVDLVYADTAVVDYAIKKTMLNSADGSPKIAKFSNEMNEALQGMTFAKTDKELTNVFSLALQKLMIDGTYDKLFNYWNVQDGKIDNAQAIEGSDDEIFAESEDE